MSLFVIITLICFLRCVLWFYFNIGKTLPLGFISPAIDYVNNNFSLIKDILVTKVFSCFPSPHAELLLGMTIGLNLLNNVPIFEESLRDTGTIHIVVVSGFNISLVFSLILKIVGSPYKLRNLLIAQFFTALYSLFSGFEAPVIRSLIMGSIVVWGKYYGRSLDTLKVLIFSAIVMLLISPDYLTSLSFQLSFMATLSLVIFSNPVKLLLTKFLKFDFFLLDDFSTSVAAQALVWPLLSFNFGKVSVLSPIINALILWTVPLCTILGGLFLIVSFVGVGDFVIHTVYIVNYLFEDFFISVINFFSNFNFISFDLKIPLWFFISYYVLIFTSVCIYYRFYSNSNEV